jgi:putative phosphoesterase
MPRIAILADIHGNFPALQAVIMDMERRNIDLVVTLGDHASGPLWPRETVAFLMQQPWIQISGNHERQLTRQPPANHGASDHYAFEQLTPEQFQWLRALPSTARILDEVLLFHGTPSNDNLTLLDTVEHGQMRLASLAEIEQRLEGMAAQVMLCGHSHIPRLVRTQNGGLIINPGSVGLQGYQDDDPEPHFVEVGAPEARYALLEKRNDKWQADLIAIPYAHQSAADQAERNGRQDWKNALLTGYVGPNHQ